MTSSPLLALKDHLYLIAITLVAWSKLGELRLRSIGLISTKGRGLIVPFALVGDEDGGPLLIRNGWICMLLACRDRRVVSTMR